jgi:hypothetical protein
MLLDMSILTLILLILLVIMSFLVLIKRKAGNLTTKVKPLFPVEPSLQPDHSSMPSANVDSPIPSEGHGVDQKPETSGFRVANEPVVHPPKHTESPVINLPTDIFPFGKGDFALSEQNRENMHNKTYDVMYHLKEVAMQARIALKQPLSPEQMALLEEIAITDTSVGTNEDVSAYKNVLKKTWEYIFKLRQTGAQGEIIDDLETYMKQAETAFNKLKNTVDASNPTISTS